MIMEFIDERIFRKLLLSFALALGVGCAGPTPPQEVRPAQIPMGDGAVSGSPPLIDIHSVAPEILVDLRYASSRNLTRRNIYPPDMPCLMQPSTAAKLRRAQLILAGQGFGLKVWDAWRPGEVQVALHDAYSKSHLFVDPREAWSKHCAGMAVDVTLVDATGRELRMPTDLDNSTSAASAYYNGRDSVVREHLSLLQTAMQAAGFVGIASEWWHFDDTDFDEAFPKPPIFARDMGISLPGP